MINLPPEVERIFHEIADLNPEQREEYFERHAVSDNVRREVEGLLASDISSSQLLHDLLERQIGATLDRGGEMAAGDQCGPYRLLREVGRGGMGEVWLAERVDGLMKRQVALKLPYLGIQASEFIRRSHRERDILASLAHQGIARLYDAGLTEGGTPFLVLEFIEGVAIDRYCDEHQLQVRARLSLFIQVLEAVQYAHSHLVIHSDLKPSNILVSTGGEAKLLDFGIAKLIRSDDTAADLTLPAAAPMTPGYAAPEQMAGQRVTTACDVFSLGVVLYELLSGKRPYVVKRNLEGALEQQAVTERPSQAARDESKARARSSTPKRLSAALKGDLDNITLKAIQQNPGKRYATVDAFKSDLNRYLAGEPVLARPDSPWYRARKFVGRHMVGVAAAAGVILALAVGFSVALWEAHVARSEAQTSDAVQQFIQDIFATNSSEQSDPMKARQTNARQLLDIGAKKIDDSLNTAPAAKEKMLSILSNLYLDLGLEDQAVGLAKKRVSAARKTFGPSDSRVAEALTSLGLMLHSSSFVNEREAVLLQAKTILDHNRDWTSRRRALLCSALAEYYQSTDLHKGLEFGGQAIAIYRTLPPSDDLARALSFQGVLYHYNDESAKAEPFLSEALSVAERLGGNLEPNIPIYAATLGECNENLMHYRSAEKNLQLAWAVARRLNGDEHVNSIETESRLGRFFGGTALYRESLQHLGHATDICLRAKGPDDPFYTPQMLFQYGEVLGMSGRFEDGLSYIARAIENRRKNRPGTRYLAQMLEGQAVLFAYIGDDDKVRQSLDQAETIEHKVGFQSGTDVVLTKIIVALNSNSRDGVAALIDKACGPIRDDAVLSKNLLNNLYWRAELALLNNDASTAQALSTRGLNLVESSEIRKYLQLWEARYSVQKGSASRLQGNPSQAFPILQRAVELETAMYDPISPDLIVAKTALANCYLDLGQRANSAKLLAEAESIRKTHPKLAEQYERPLGALRERMSRS